ncbi:MAG: hypothetical protein JNL01_05370 [Bdellovibrionales bacterium]|nr:hypothetical protein [Bdellovibrionales bacterium]
MKNPIQNQKGQGLTEYLILLILVGIISIVSVQSLGKTIQAKIKLAREKIHTEVDLEAGRGSN